MRSRNPERGGKGVVDAFFTYNIAYLSRMPSKGPLNDYMERLRRSENPIDRFLGHGGPWGNAMLMEEEWEKTNEAKRQRAARKAKMAGNSISKWEAQLEAVLKKPKNPAALRHIERLKESLREAYTEIGRDSTEVDALFLALNAKVKAEAAAKAAETAVKAIEKVNSKRQTTAKNKKSNGRSSTAKSPKGKKK
jgi:hypothetical protein